MNGDIGGGIDAQLDQVSLEANYFYNDAAVNNDAFTSFARENEHRGKNPWVQETGSG